MRRTIFLTVFLSVFGILFFYVGGKSEAASVSGGKGPNVTIESTDLEPFSINQKTEPEQKPVFYTNDNFAVGFNDDAEPNVSTRF